MSGTGEFATVKAAVEAALGKKPFSLGGAALSSPPISSLLSAQFGRDALVLEDAEKQAESTSSITVRGTLSGSFMGAERLTVSAAFAVAGGEASLSATVSGFPSGWTLSQAFSSLKGSLFDSLSYTEPSFTLDSAGATTLPQDFPAAYGMPTYPAALAASLRGGLAFGATASVIAGFDGIERLIGGSSWEMSGPVATAEGLPSISLTSKTLEPFSAGPFSLGFSIAMAAALVLGPDPGSRPVGVTSVLQFEAKLEKQLSESTLEIPLVARTFTPSLETLVIAGELSALHPLTAADIGLLIDDATATELPSVFPKLEEIGLSALSITIAPATMTVVSLDVAVEFLPHAKGEWSVFEGLIVFDGLTIGFTGLPPSGHSSVGVDARATIAGGTLDAGVVLPATEFHCKLEQGTIDIAEIVEKVSSKTIAMPQVTCTSLAFTGSVTEEWYRLQATVADDWKIALPGSSEAIGITQVGMDLTYVPGAPTPLTGQVIGNFEIGKAQLYASAGYEAGAAPGWLFEGGTQGEQEINVTDVVEDVLHLFGWSLPGNPPQVELKNLNLAFHSATHEFSLRGMTSVQIGGVDCELGAQVQNDAEGKLFNGYLWIGQNAFELDFQAGRDTVVAGSWTATEESSILSLDHLIDALELSLPDLPSSLNPTLTGAAIVYDIGNDVLVLIGDTQDGSSALLVVEGKPTTQVGFAALAKVGLNLSDLPLVGQRLAAVATAEIDALQVSVASAPLASAGPALNERVASYAAMLSKLTYPSFPAPPSGTTAKAWLGATFDYGSGKVPLGLALDGSGSSAKAPAARALAAPAQIVPGAPNAPAPATGTATSDGTVWFDVQRSFGPVTLQRVGACYQSSAQALWFELDAQLAFGPLTLNLLGLGLGSPIDGFKPEFAIGGLGIDYAEPPLTIAGGLVNLAPKGASYLEFEGGVTIGTGEFSLTAFGYYGDKSGFPSLFLFGDVAYDFGGPPQFFVTGLALGFGYNSALRTPTIDQVAGFPFIEVLPNSTAPGPGALGSNPTPLEALTTLLGAEPPWVAPSSGSLWFGAGITFTTFELLNSQALVTVQTGKELVIALLGTSRAQFPQEGNGPLYAYVELDLEAVLAPQQGVFSFQAMLAKTSFLLDRACVLTGGFAFFVWFGENQHAGDFVLTLGGYNPGFTPPSHYPAVQRLGFHWSLDSSISIQGGAYFALTPSALMLGGELEATFQSGDLKAWFDAHADVVIQWKPFWVHADIGITVGASYKIELLFTSFTVSIELGCELTLWGPPTGGTVEVDWFVISFSIPFGHEEEPPPEAATWSDVEKMLPSNGSAAAQPISISPADGLHPAASTPKPSMTDADTSSGATEGWTVRAGAFAFTSSGIIPATKLTVGDAHSLQGAGFDVRPLAHDSDWQNVESTHEVRIAPVASPREDVSASFSAVPVFKDVPSSLWGEPVGGEGPSIPVPAGDRQLLRGRLSGVQLRVNPAQIGCSAGPVDVAVSLAFDDLHDQGSLPLSAAAKAMGDVPAWTAGTVGTIADPEHGIGSQASAQARKAIVQALAQAGYAPATRDDTMTVLASEAACLFADVPLVVA